MKLHLRRLQTPMVKITQKRVQEFNMAYFEISEWFDHQSNKFDLYVIESCDHFLE